MRRSRGRLAWDGCRGLADRGFAAADPLVYEERRFLGLVHRESLFVSREVAGVPWGEVWDAADPAGAADLLERTGAWIGRLHRAGVDHRALAPKNLFVGPAGELVPIEYDRVRFRRRVSWPSRARALGMVVQARLERIGGPTLGRLFDAYAAETGLDAAGRARVEREAMAWAGRG